MSSLTDIFLTLVKIDSPTSEEEKLANFLIDHLKDKVSVVKRDKYGNVYARIGGKGEPLFFSAHMDTVEPGRGVKPVIKDGYIQSDGSTILGGDNKSALACILEVLSTIKSQQIKHRPLEIVFTKEEESGTYGSINFDYRLLRAKRGFCFDYSAPIGTLITASPFYERFDIKVKGRSAHASLPKEAINVLPFIGELLSNTTLGKLDEDSLMNIGVIEGGSVRNTIPGEVVIHGEIRSFIESKLLKHKKQFIQRLNKLGKKYQVELEMEFVRENGGYKLKNSQMLNLAQKSLIAIGVEPKLLPAWGVSDANIFREKGLDCINLADGGEGAHTTRERIKVTELEKLAQLMVSIIKT